MTRGPNGCDTLIVHHSYFFQHTVKTVDVQQYFDNFFKTLFRHKSYNTTYSYRMTGQGWVWREPAVTALAPGGLCGFIHDERRLTATARGGGAVEWEEEASRGARGGGRAAEGDVDLCCRTTIMTDPIRAECEPGPEDREQDRPAQHARRRDGGRS